MKFKEDKREVIELNVFTSQDAAGAWNTWVCLKGAGGLTLPSYWNAGSQSHLSHFGVSNDPDRWLRFEGDCLGHSYSLSKLGNATIGRWMAIRRAKKTLRKRRIVPKAQAKQSTVKVKV